MRITILGCGGSGGVPLLGGADGRGHWGACDPANPRNRRRRVSILVETAQATILVDSSPDLRQQLLDAGVRAIDAVLWTHDHADHLHGIDELRHIRPQGGKPIPCWGAAATLAEIGRRFAYAVIPQQTPVGTLYPPFLRPQAVAGPFTIEGVPVVPFRQDHGLGTETLGYRIGDMAYSTDVVDLPEDSFAALGGLQLWIVDCLRDAPHPTHAHVEKTLGWIERVRPRRALLTHMNHTLDYEDLRRRCPPGVEPAYDGLVVEL